MSPEEKQQQADEALKLAKAELADAAAGHGHLWRLRLAPARVHHDRILARSRELANTRVFR